MALNDLEKFSNAPNNQQDTPKSPANDQGSMNFKAKSQFQKKHSLKNLFTQSNLIPLLTNMPQDRKEKLLSLMPPSQHYEKNENSLLECLTSPLCIETCSILDGLIRQGQAESLLKQLDFPESAINASSSRVIALFAKSLDKELSEDNNNRDQQEK